MQGQILVLDGVGLLSTGFVERKRSTEVTECIHPPWVFLAEKVNLARKIERMPYGVGGAHY